jgi:hypothetical protein
LYSLLVHAPEAALQEVDTSESAFEAGKLAWEFDTLASALEPDNLAWKFDTSASAWEADTSALELEAGKLVWEVDTSAGKFAAWDSSLPAEMEERCIVGCG